MVSILIFVLGLCLGSFINVVALRYVRNEDWIQRSSQCFACGRKLRISENIPIWGWISNYGKTSCCGQKMPMRYILVEIFCGFWAVVSIKLIGLYPALIFSPFFVLNMIIFLTDFEDFTIPDFASLGGVALGLLVAFIGIEGASMGGMGISFQLALIGGIFGFCVLYGINFLYKLLRGYDGLGMGDAKLMAMYGVWLGPQAVLPILFAAAMLGALFGGILMLAGRASLMQTGNADNMASVLPFGCFLVVVAMLWVVLYPIGALPIIPISW